MPEEIKADQIHECLISQSTGFFNLSLLLSKIKKTEMQSTTVLPVFCVGEKLGLSC